ncbi:MAG: hypothetical protein IJP21_02400 [Clostridia bacterium]|nr:hypothetical protein [Clostridia bacterium]
MKKIGFVDYYISEWHANNYPKWIKAASEEAGYDFEVAYAWAQEYVSPVDGRNTDEWCEAMGITRCQTVEELCEKSDYIVVLAPSNPEKHLELAKMVFPCGKTTYMDKSFADTTENAKEIFALAEKYGVNFFSTSALRYATELDEIGACSSMSTLGSGGSVEEYIIHQAEMLVKKVGVGAKQIKAQRINEKEFTFTIKYDDNRRASMHFASAAPFCVMPYEASSTKMSFKQIKSDYFLGLIKDILRFFETGKTSFDVAEILEVNRIMVGAIKSKGQPDTWIEL